MGRAWDAFVPPPAVWDECLRVLKPGGHLLAFAGSRTADLMGMSVRLAGFEIRDTITWHYGNGFPKSLDVGKAIDRRRDDHVDLLAVTARIRAARDAAGATNRDIDAAFGTNGMAGHWTSSASQPAVPTWEQWQQLREMLALADDMDAEVWRLNGRKGTPGEAWQNAEVLAIDARFNEPSGVVSIGQGGRVAVERQIKAPATDAARQWSGWGTALKPASEPIIVARKPLAGTVAQTVLGHGTGALNIDACRVATTDSLNGGAYSENPSERWDGAENWRYQRGGAGDYKAPVGRWPANVVLSHAAVWDDDADELVDACTDGCVDGCPVAELDAQSGVLKSGDRAPGVTKGGRRGGIMGEHVDKVSARAFVGDSGGASRFFPTFRYQAKAPTRERPKVDGVAHPTVKPVALMQWLVRLVCPPGGVVLEPFAGSGTTVEACLLESARCVAVERDDTYLPLIAHRVNRATKTPTPGAESPRAEAEPAGATLALF
jgi:hypothetical protein